MKSQDQVFVGLHLLDEYKLPDIEKQMYDSTVPSNAGKLTQFHAVLF